LFICISPLIYSYIYECGPEWISRDGYFTLKLTILFVDIFCFLVALALLGFTLDLVDEEK